MEEVIFAGTASRKSRGMAEVTLVIDNSTGILPIDYSEVAISRRMYRSGESEYSINNNQCRLRDIRELIMDTGIGVDGYSIIGQGKIADIVSNKTDSRREIFEEASGIVKYRTKKAESERKLEASNANLERVSDIIAEIESRIDLLKEDSEKASEYLTLRDRYKELQINITLKNIENLELKNEYIKDDIFELKAKIDDLKEDITSIEQALTEIQRAGTFESEWGNYKYGTAYRNANVGAVVAIEVETGDVLAMASYPAFDPNLFATGISKEDWNALQGENLRDPLSPLPLFNVAARTAVQPGSTFKMVTATAALESGLDPTRKLKDGGAVKLGNRTYGCLVWNRNRSNHGYINLYEALEVSCNYYFFDIATGRDFSRGVSLGFKDPINIEKITSYAQQYGLGLKTGIEIPETVIPVPSQERKLAQIKAMLRNVLIGRAEIYFEQSLIKDKEKLNKNIMTIVGWTEENPSRNELIRRLGTLGIKENFIETVADLCKYTYFNQATWTTGDELIIAIGQGENAYTPLQMTNYIATIGNEGVHNKVSLIGAIEGKGKVIKEPGKKIAVDEQNLEHIIEGMKRVVSGPRGSLKGAFANFPVQVAGKTGTAERGGKINPPDEVEYIKQHLSKINSSLRWENVEKEMERLMKDYPDVYTTKNYAVRQAVINLSNGRVTSERIDAYKANYDPFAWVMTLAPAEDPKIAVGVLLFQGGTAGYAAPVAREVIAKYLQLDKTYEDYSLETSITQ